MPFVPPGARLLEVFIDRLCSQGEPVQDPFRRGIGHAVQWYDCLRNRPEAMVESAIDECLSYIMSHPVCFASSFPPMIISIHSYPLIVKFRLGVCSRRCIRLRLFPAAATRADTQ